ncbi:MAG: SGNH/GDSL hydrolase family protein, partial [Pseudomonadota bacterium]
MGWQKLVMIAAILTGCGTPETDTAPVDTGSAALPQPAVNAERSNPPIDQAGETGAIIVMLGDSLTAGFGLPSDQALPDQIGDRLEASGFKVQMVNSGVSGDTTAGGLARYDFSV